MAPKKIRIPEFKAFGEKVQFFRERAGLDQLALGRNCGYASGSAITQIEQGEYNPPLDKILKIAAVLRIPPAWLLADELANASPYRLDLRDIPEGFHATIGDLFHLIKEHCHGAH